MRLIRSILRPDKSSLQFGRHRVIETSNACLRTREFSVVTVKRADVPGSNGQLRGRSSTASLPSDAPYVKKARRNVSKDERKSMVEKYVHKYMTMNGGKFPTASAAQINVGGSYYVVRNILQEMEHNFKTLSTQSKNVSSVEKSKVKMIDISIRTHETPLTSEEREAFNQGKPCLDNPSSRRNSRLKKGRCNDPKKSVDTLLSTKSSEEGRLLTESMDWSNSHSKVDLINNGYYHGTNVKERTFDELKPKDEEQLLIKSKMPNGVLHEVHSEVTDPESKPSLWKNLKSFANGILSSWRS